MISTMADYKRDEKSHRFTLKEEPEPLKKVSVSTA